MLTAGVLLVLLLALVLVRQMRTALGAGIGTVFGTLVLLGLGSAWGALEWARRQEPPPPEDMTTLPATTSQACFRCHESHYTSWHRSYHRSMTREATAENVKADFNNAVYHYGGVTSRMSRAGDRYLIDTVDPEWADSMFKAGIPLEKAGPAPRQVFTVDRLVGSHWFQQMLHRDEQGRYLRLPLLYHLVERRWIHINGAFLNPGSEFFFSKLGLWNNSCLFCHNTRVNMNPQPASDSLRPGYKTEVGELGIACEACHGAAERHVRAHQNPTRRLAQRYCGEADPTIVNPRRLSVPRSDDVCAQCHSGLRIVRPEVWTPDFQPNPFLAGGDLNQFFHRFWSSVPVERMYQTKQFTTSGSEPPAPLDSRFWGDGTPLTTALEYQGMALSACYQEGRGELRCLTCHTMHGSDPNHQVKDGMRSNEACYGCHGSYRERLVEHTHHAADSPGSLCYNCHMPYQVYSLLNGHRSHRIAIPRVRDSLGTGKPHACNLCHLDRSLGWTSEHLHNWYGTRPEPLSDDDRTIASSLLHLAGSDARSRAVVANAFNWPAAQQASGRDWPAQLLLRTLEQERYAAVRYLQHRALRSLWGRQASDYDYLGSPAERAAALRGLRLKLEIAPRPARGRYPHLPLTAEGLLADEVMARLLRERKDPDVRVHE